MNPFLRREGPIDTHRFFRFEVDSTEPLVLADDKITGAVYVHYDASRDKRLHDFVIGRSYVPITQWVDSNEIGDIVLYSHQRKDESEWLAEAYWKGLRRDNLTDLRLRDFTRYWTEFFEMVQIMYVSQL